MRDLAAEQLSKMQAIVIEGMRRSSQVLSEMTGREIGLLNPVIGLVPISRIPDIAGGGECEAVGVYLGVDGDICAHTILLFPRKSAFELIDLLLERPLGTTTELDEMGRSCLGEVGNITGSFFLNALAEKSGLLMRPTPPEVIQDMVGAILSMVLAELSVESDEGFMVETAFAEKTKAINGFFFVIPVCGSLEKIMESLGAGC